MQLRNFTIPEVATAFSEIQLVAPDTVEFSRATMPEAYRLIRVLYRFINPGLTELTRQPLCSFASRVADRHSRHAIVRLPIDDLHRNRCSR